MIELKEGDSAPDFERKDGKGVSESLKKYKGKYIILYFYPKDNTPGCVVQACQLRDMIEQLNKLDVVVMGVSTDDNECHAHFAAVYKLPFPLIADTDASISKEYGVYEKQKILGIPLYTGISRSIFIIDPDGKIERIMYRMKARQTADDVFAALEQVFAAKDLQKKFQDVVK